MSKSNGDSGEKTPREILAEQVAAFLEAGKKIDVIPDGVSAMSKWTPEKESKHARERVLGLRPSVGAK